MKSILPRVAIASILAAALVQFVSAAQAEVGATAQLCDTWDENEKMVSMADMIDGEPFILTVGTAS